MNYKEYNKLAGIYKWENKINHKCYIGQSVDLGCRIRHHINNFKHHRYDTPLYMAFSKYGIENFSLLILFFYNTEDLENVNDIKQSLDLLEKWYIKKYKSYGKTGYNQTRGGDAGILGYKFTEEQRKRASKAVREVSQKYYKRVYLYNINSKWTVSFPSIQYAAITLGCTHSQITRLCNWSQLLLSKEWVGSFSEDNLTERAEYVKQHHPMINRKRPKSGLKRTFKTPDGKKILAEDHKRRISDSLCKYKVEVYVNGKLDQTFENTKIANEQFFHFKNNSSVMDTVVRHTLGGIPYKGIYTFKLINKK